MNVNESDVRALYGALDKLGASGIDTQGSLSNGCDYCTNECMDACGDGCNDKCGHCCKQTAQQYGD